jgi:fibronectin-binding autotransporter adhesin
MFRSRPRSLSTVLALVGVAFLIHSPRATAVERTWLGNNTFQGFWSNPSLWSESSPPEAGDSALFTGTGTFGTNVYDLNLDGQLDGELLGITFAADAMAFTVQGGDILAITETISNLSANTQTLEMPLYLNRASTFPPGSTTFNGDGAGDIVLNNNNNRAWQRVYVTGTGTGGVVIPSGKSLVGSSGGTSTFSTLQVGNASSDGKITISGTVRPTAAGATGANGNPAEIVIDGGLLTIPNSLDIGGNDRTFGIVIPAGSGSLSVINGGTVDVSTGSEFSVGGSADDGTGYLLVDGAGSNILGAAEFGTGTSYLGLNADTTATISNGGTVVLGYNFDGTQNYVGAKATTTLSILSGGSLTYNGITYFGGSDIAGSTGGTANVLIEGAGSTLTLANSDSTKYLAYDGTATMTLRNSGTANFDGAVVVGQSSTSTGTLTVAGGTLNATSVTLGAVAGAAGTFNFGEGNAATASFTGTIASGGGTGTVNFNSTAEQTVSNTLSGTTLSVVQLGSGKTTVTGTNTFGGGVTITAGTINAGSADAFGSSGTISFGAGTLQYSASNQTDYSGRFSSALGQQYSIDTNAQDVTFASALTSTGGTLTKLGTGTLTLTGSNTYSGGTTVSGGTLAGTTSGLQGAITNNATVEFSQATAGTYAGVISGSGNLVKSGAGAVTLSGNNTFGGTTTVSAGTLLINGDQSSATGSLSVLAGATLGGDGTIGGNVSVAGTHSPGNSPGLQTINGDLTYSGGASAVTWELIANTTGSAGTNYDQIALPTGNLAFSGATALALSFDGAGSVVDWENTFWNVDRNWLLYDLSGGTTSNINNFTITTADWQDSNSLALSNSSRAGATFNIALVGQDVTLNYVAPVPEPSTAVIGLAAVAAGLVAVRLRRSVK